MYGIQNKQHKIFAMFLNTTHKLIASKLYIPLRDQECLPCQYQLSVKLKVTQVYSFDLYSVNKKEQN